MGKKHASQYANFGSLLNIYTENRAYARPFKTEFG